jgi:hypothetical protein
MTYAYDGLARATTGAGGPRIVDMAVILGTVAVSLALGAATPNRLSGAHLPETPLEELPFGRFGCNVECAPIGVGRLLVPV